ncbi:hypothetical protein BGW42_002364 [Actinomortierella wolfii]|nr:hypothetical protein BGW42_002364 [Actinomortierella wolfii]
MASIATKQQHQHQQSGMPGQHGSGPQRKHNKKKSRSSWKAGFKSTPSSPLQSAISVKSPQPSSVLAEIPTHGNTSINNATNRGPTGGGGISGDKRAVKDSGDMNNRHLKPTGMTRPRTGSTSSILVGEEFLQHVDIQLMKAQLEENRNSSNAAQTPRPPSKQDSTDRHITPAVPPSSGNSQSRSLDGSTSHPSKTTQGPAEGYNSSLGDHTAQPIIVSLWDYLKEEMTASDFESTQELKRERVVNFFSVPIAFEKVPEELVTHTMVLFYQMVTLNVAVNSYSNALLTLLISNQFVEIKASVFKRFEKENLFQLSCSDIVERFQLSVFMTIIALRNLVELSASPPSPFSIYPQSFVPLFSSMTTVARLLTPCLLVLGCETLVDWLKHAFITKFNQIRPTVYSRFVDILSRDLVVGSPTRLPGKSQSQTMFVDQSPMVSRRIGLASLPLACLVICLATQTLQMVLSTLPQDDVDMAVPVAPLTESLTATRTLCFDNLDIDWVMPSVEFSSMGTAAMGLIGVTVWFAKIAWAVLGEIMVVAGHTSQAWLHEHGISPEMGRKALEWFVICLACMATYACLVAIKLLVGINLLGYAHQRYLTMESREHIERQTDRMLRESAAAKEERAMNSTVAVMLDGRNSSQTSSNANVDVFLVGGEKRQLATLDTIERYTLFKSRIP